MTLTHFDLLSTTIGPHDILDGRNEPIPASMMQGAVASIETQLSLTTSFVKPEPRLLVCNLFGGPGTGKSTNAALLFGKLKVAGVNAELVTEYAKDLTWEMRHAALSFQPYVTAKQIWRVARLRGQVDVVVTDSPFVLGLAYPTFGVTPSFERFVIECFDLFNNYNIFLSREDRRHAYNPAGRRQTEDEARAKDMEIRDMLHKHEVVYENVPVLDGEETADLLVANVLKIIQKQAQG